MDDSGSDFQSPKKQFKKPEPKPGPSKTKKPKNTSSKTKKQKDIKSAFGIKQNDDLISYTLKFNKICKNIGVGVQSEDLQLAVALSKSLHEFENCNATEGPPEVPKQTTRSSSAKIKQTLREYGFSIPEVKKQTKKKGKGTRKISKLLTTSLEDKRNLLLQKFTGLISEPGPFVHMNKSSSLNGTLLNKANGSFFEMLNEEEYFYLENELIEYNINTTGSLLRDWSKIPGIVLSPVKPKRSIRKFCEFIKTQDELDRVLSGNFDYIGPFLDQYKDLNKEVLNEEILKSLDEENIQNSPCQDYCFSPKNQSTQSITSINHGTPNNGESENDGNLQLIVDGETNTDVEVMHKAVYFLERSHSPDMFDDDVSIVESTQTVKNLQKNSTKIMDEFMDLTECVPATKIECKQNVRTVEKINLCCENDNIKQISEPKDCLDLTNSSDDSLPEIAISQNTKTISESCPMSLTCVANSTNYAQSNNHLYATKICQDIVLCSDDSNDSTLVLSFQNYSFTSKAPVCIQETINNSTSNLTVSKMHSLSELENAKQSLNYSRTSSPIYEDNLSSNYSSNKSNTSESFSNRDVESESDCSNHTNASKPDSMSGKTKSSIPKDDSGCFSNSLVHGMENKCESNPLNYSNDYISLLSPECSEIITTSSVSLLRPDNIEACNLSKDPEGLSQKSSNAGNDNNLTVNDFNLNNDAANSYNVIVDDNCISLVSPDDNNSNELNNGEIQYELSQHSYVDHFFDLQDEELHYTMINYSKDSLDSPKDNDSLPSVSIIKNACTVENASINSTNITPDNKYIIKIDNVTPALDYESLTTPQRNLELDKYGIKPLKKRRAIQMLEYLYNETHPYEDDIELPSKRLKMNEKKILEENQGDLEKTDNEVDFKDVENMENVENLETVENLANVENLSDYNATALRPVIKNLCEDNNKLIFQKREKSKVHSCRVPLHIVFHNYINARPRLLEKLFQYEPIKIDLIHKQLVKDGYKFDAKDLLRFMDSKCITVKTMDNNGRNEARTKRR